MTFSRLRGIKQGSNFEGYLDYTIDAIGEVFPASDLSAKVRGTNNEFRGNLTITAHPTVVGRFLFSAAAAMTAGWPIGDVIFDVKRVSGGVTTYTDTVIMAVVRPQS